MTSHATEVHVCLVMIDGERRKEKGERRKKKDIYIYIYDEGSRNVCMIVKCCSCSKIVVLLHELVKRRNAMGIC